MAKIIKEGSAKPGVTEETALAGRGARLGQYYLIEPDEGTPPQRCDNAWEAAFTASLKKDEGQLTPEEIVMRDLGLAYSIHLPGPAR